MSLINLVSIITLDIILVIWPFAKIITFFIYCMTSEESSMTIKW